MSRMTIIRGDNNPNIGQNAIVNNRTERTPRAVEIGIK